MNPCSVWGCGRHVRKAGMCHAHYEYKRRTGLEPTGPIHDNDRDRFLAKIDIQPDGCWLWTGARSGSRRYGSGTYAGRVRPAHRIAIALHTGSLPPSDMDVDHLCRVTLCVNPDHLEVVPHRENVLRGAAIQANNARKTHCIRGHEFTPENTIGRGGHRRCARCVDIYNAKRRGEQWAIEAWGHRVHDEYALRELEVSA